MMNQAGEGIESFGQELQKRDETTEELRKSADPKHKKKMDEKDDEIRKLREQLQAGDDEYKRQTTAHEAELGDERKKHNDLHMRFVEK